MARKQQSRPTSVPKLNDDRLCWLAVRDHVDKHTRKLGLIGWLGVLGSQRGRGSARLGGNMRRDEMSDQKMDYAFAVDQASENLTHEERLHLRATGLVPDWFLADIDRRAKEIRKQRS
ncbi:hypothetical protein [Streptacidiphilus anmyonensis]|uniref:hypothetical protein n=1 Tax=Streptacidiphilus anmyonensis TaxID=405782 RepID=UPI0005A61947|nr:hypothetical protein [Streptacidiphilus anmyonensis]